MKLRDVDRGYKARMKALNDLGAHKLTVGIHEQEGSGGHGETTVADVGAFHEFGTSDIPERSFIRGWFDEEKEPNDAALSAAMKKVGAGKLSEDVALNQVGAVMAGNVVQRIRSGIDPPLADSTIDRKGSSTPLVDSGQLTQAVTWKVEKK